MGISKDRFCRILFRVSQLWLEESDRLSEIDSRFGDGDHGVTMKKIGLLVKEQVEGWDKGDYFDFLDGLGDAIMAISGGSAGPLYGTLIGGLGTGLEGVEEIEGVTLKAMFAGSLSAMKEITKATVGDKTMMDSLIPAVTAAQAAEDDVKAVLLAAAEAAAKGAKDSEQFVSKFGRARSYKEQTIGTPDAGALSTAMLFQGLAEGYIGLSLAAVGR